jgi:phospholipase/lecithinase/hemolysin
MTKKSSVCGNILQGLTISFDEQIERDYTTVYGGLVQQLGQAQASIHVARSIFTVGIGGNDIAARVLSGPKDQRQMSSDQQFIASLAQSLKRKLQRMYKLGMRRLFFVGTGPLGCYPLLRQRSLAMECDAEASSLSMQYSAAAATILRDMSTRRPDFEYSSFDQYTALLGYIQEPEANGFAEAKAACCALGNGTALLICTPANALCADRASHVFWDGAHLTEVTTEKLVAVAFNGSAPLVSPVNLKQLSAP